MTEKASPRAPLEIGIRVPGLAAGEEAFVTVAAVDQGILNLTAYQPPDPDGWYFGQRRLGVALRDLYGQLIDRMQGVPGVVRSGGDGGIGRIQGPPPTEELVAFFSGIVRLDAQGQARVSFPLPDFNGSVRVMAMAWTRAGVGHAVKDVLVRDPVVMAAALPRFLAPGDRSRLLLDLTHLEGPAGDFSLTLAGDVRSPPLPRRGRPPQPAPGRGRQGPPQHPHPGGDRRRRAAAPDAAHAGRPRPHQAADPGGPRQQP